MSVNKPAIMIWCCSGTRSVHKFSAASHHVLPGTHLFFPAHILRGVGALSRLGHTLDASMDQLFVIGGKRRCSVVMPRLQHLMQTQAGMEKPANRAFYGGE